MKTEFKKMFLVLIASAGIIIGVTAQKGAEDGSRYGHGQDSINCLRNWSIYREFFKHGNYTDALPAWRNMYNECPKSYETMYIDGIKMFNSFIEKEKDVAIQNKFIDTLEMLYMQRIKYFNKKGDMLGRFGIDFLRYRRTEIADQEKGYNLLKECIQLEQKKTPWLVLSTYFTTSIIMYNAQKLTAEQVIENYTTISDLVDERLKVKPNDADFIKIKEIIDQQLAVSGVANCNTLTAIFTPKFEQNQNDIETVKKITKLLDDNKCTETELYEKAAEKQNELEPSARSAYFLANLFLKKENYDKAADYFKQAIEKETDATEKAKYLNILGNIVLANYKQAEQAKKYALEAIKLRSNWGAPYILIGKAYIAGRENCGTNDFEKSAIFWFAVDKFVQAKNVDASCAEEANSLITTYSKYYPNKDDAFFRDVKPGDAYKINCWINESTTARF